MPDVLLTEMTALLREPGPWITVLVDASADREDPQGLRGSRRQSVRDTVARLGDPSTADAVHAALGEVSHLPSPSLQYVVAKDGEVAFSTALQDGAEDVMVVESSPVPLLVPLLEHYREDLVHLIVQVSGVGGDITVSRTAATDADATETVEPDPDVIEQPSHGGVAPRTAENRPMEMRKRALGEVAAEVDRSVREERPCLVVVAGEGRHRHTFLEALGAEASSLVVEYDAETRAAGADDAGLAEFVAEQLDGIRTKQVHDALDVLQGRLGREGGAATADPDAVVEALRQAQAQTVFVDAAAFEDRTLLALEDAPWVAATEEDAGPIAVVGSVPAGEAIVRAALLTDATVHIVPASRIGGAAAALLRWATPSE